MKTLYSSIETSCIEYIALSGLCETTACVLFTGKFQGRDVVWEANIAAQQGRQFIEIDEVQDKNTISIQIGLNVTSITEPVVLKTILMVKQYRNLQFGRHEFSGPDK